MQVQAYLFFDGRCEEAIEFYQQALGAKVDMLMRFKDCPEPAQAGMPAADKVMHANLRIGDTTVHVSDGRCQGNPSFQGFAMSIAAQSEAEADRLFAALSAGGNVQMPMNATFFARRFGMVADRFGVGWMVIVAK